jgi:peptidoglycan/LPS O-acetylase OafA/YrhL
LRAIAVFLVIISHWLPFENLPLGATGVDIFFVISGYLISSILLKYKENISKTTSRAYLLKIFYQRRFLRIFPIYYGLLIFSLIFIIGAQKRNLIWFFLYLSNFRFSLYGWYNFKSVFGFPIDLTHT